MKISLLSTIDSLLVDLIINLEYNTRMENVIVTPRFKGEPFDKMLRRFKNQCERANIVKDYKKKEFFDKPSAIKNRKNQELKRTKLNNRRKEKSLQERRKILANQRFR